MGVCVTEEVWGIMGAGVGLGASSGVRREYILVRFGIGGETEVTGGEEGRAEKADRGARRFGDHGVRSGDGDAWCARW
jgi:hypothetical protein